MGYRTIHRWYGNTGLSTDGMGIYLTINRWYGDMGLSIGDMAINRWYGEIGLSIGGQRYLNVIQGHIGQSIKGSKIIKRLRTVC